MTTDIEKIEPTIAALTSKREELVARGDEVAEQKKRISYSALAENDKRARTELTRLGDEAARIAAMLESIAAASAEADRRLQIARQVEVRAADRMQAKLDRELAIFASAGEEADRALRDFVEASGRMRDALYAMHGLGRTVPSRFQFEVSTRNAVISALRRSIWSKYFEPLEASQRASFGDLVRRWSGGIESNVKQRIGETEAA